MYNSIILQLKSRF